MNLCTVEDQTVVFSPERKTYVTSRDNCASVSTRGPIVSHFRLVRQLGKGGMGTVYLAEDLTLGRNVAIKFMDRSVIGDMVDEEDDCTVIRQAVTQTLEQRFIREAKSAATISHQNLAQIYEAHFEDDEWFIAMEYINGNPLDALLKERKVFTKDEIINIFRQTVLGLKFAWDRHRIVHRDVKPANIMVTPEGRVKIVDLGLAKPLDSDQILPDVSNCGAALGTPYYASPEQARAESDLDQLTDIFSLGATLYEICTGDRAFAEMTPAAVYERQVNKDYVPITDYRSDIPRALIRLIDRMLAPERAERISDYNEILKILEQLDRPDDTVKIKVPRKVKALWDYFADLDYGYLFPTHSCRDKALLYRPMALICLTSVMFPLMVLAVKPGPARLVWLISTMSAIMWGYAMIRDCQLTQKPLVNIGKLAGSWTFMLTVGYMLITRLESVEWLYAAEMGRTGLPSITASFFLIALIEEPLKLLPFCLPFLTRHIDLRPRNYLVAGAAVGLCFSLKSAVLFSMDNWSSSITMDPATTVMTLGTFAVIPALHAMWTGIAAWFLAAARRGGGTQWFVVAIGLLISITLHAVWSASMASLPGLLSGIGTVMIFLFYYERTRKDSRDYYRLQVADKR